MPTRRRTATIALAGWTLLVWTTRINNVWTDDALTTSDKWGRTGLALTFTVLAVAVAVAVYRRTDWRGLAVRLLAGWTIGVWVTRSIGIARGDHSGTFIAVHLVLAVISVVLSGLALRETADRPGVTSPV